MNRTAKWFVAGLAVLTAAGALYAVPAMAAGSWSRMPGWRLAAGAGQTTGPWADMQPMHNAMYPLLRQMSAMREQMMAAVAEKLGLASVDDLYDAFADGKSLADLAEAKKVSPDDIQAVMTQSVQEFLDKGVKDGSLTQEQADQLKEFHVQYSQSCVTSSGGAGFGMMGGARGARGGFGMMGGWRQ